MLHKLTPEITLKEAAILDYIIFICRSMNKKVVAKRKNWKTWVDYGKLIEDMPLLHLKSTGSISKKIDKLVEYWYLEKTLYDRKAYLDMTEMVDKLFLSGNDVVAQKKQRRFSQETNNTTKDNSNNIINNVFNYRLEQNIKQHRKLSSKIKSSIKRKLKEFTEDEIKEAIETYSKVYHNKKCFFSYKWGLNEMLDRGFERFLDGEVEDYYSKQYKNQKKKVPQKKKSNPFKDKKDKVDSKALQEFRKKIWK